MSIRMSEHHCPFCGAKVVASERQGGPSSRPACNECGKDFEPALAATTAFGSESTGEPSRLPDTVSLPGECAFSADNALLEKVGSWQRYDVIGEIGRGGVGVVLHARDRRLGRDLAIKVLQDNRLTNENTTRRFEAEAQIGSQLQHPGITLWANLPAEEVGEW
jgi:hypothetical protein